jgi:hypothetical protein
MHSTFCRPARRRRRGGGAQEVEIFQKKCTTQVYTVSTAQDEVLAQRLLISAQKILVAALVMIRTQVFKFGQK